MNKLTAFLEEMKKVGENATPGPWEFDGYWTTHQVKENNTAVICSTGISICDDAQKDLNSRYIATARNNWEKLIKMNEILLEACEHIEKNYAPGSCCDIAHGNSDMDGHMVDISRKAIEECVKISGS